MRHGRFITALFTLGSAFCADAQSVAEIVDALADMPDYAASVTYAVTLPQADDDIVYTVDLQQPASADSYLIDWRVDTPSGPVDGFTAWFDGHFYNFRNKRLQESHADWDATAPDGARAVQNSAQFASLLPSRLAMELRELDNAERYRYTLSTTSSGEVRISAVRLTAGEEDAELEWTFDSTTLRPRRFYADYNPGSIAGQQVTAIYSDSPSPTLHSPLSEELLRERYPEAFERYRESQFAIESMRGQQLPGFSLPQCGAAGRFTRRATEPLEAPTAVVLLDSEATLAPQLIEAVRAAIGRLPSDAAVLWACTGKNPDAVSELLGPLRQGEKAILGSRSLARDCGAATLPVVMACDAKGCVTDLIVGLNNQLEIDVIRMFSTIK